MILFGGLHRAFLPRTGGSHGVTLFGKLGSDMEKVSLAGGLTME
jgi:hypothetical protein